MNDALPPEGFSPTPLPANEGKRLEALRRYRILDTPTEVAFDRITHLGGPAV